MIYFEILILIGSALLSIYALDVVYSSFFKKNDTYTFKFQIIIKALFVLTFVLQSMLISTGYLIVSVNFLLFLLVGVFYDAETKHKISLIIVWQLITIIVEVLIVYLIVFLLNISVTNFQQSFHERLIANILVYMSLVVLAISLKHKKYKNKPMAQLLHVNSFFIMITPLLSIIIFLCLVYLTANATRTSQSFVTIIAVCLIAMNIFSFYFIEKANESRELRMKNEILTAKSIYYLETEKALIKNLDNIRKLQHDLKYKFLFIKTRIDENTPIALNEISEYVNNILGHALSDQKKDFTRNNSLNQLLNLKEKMANDFGINTEFKVMVSENLEINMEMLYIVLGNLIDNALEHYDDRDSLLKKVEVIMVEEEGNVLIEIRNPFSKQFEIVDGLPKTTNRNKVNHGWGLKSVDEIVKRECGCFKWEFEEHIFFVQVLLFKR